MLLVCPAIRYDELARGAGGTRIEGLAVPLVNVEVAAVVLLLVGSRISETPMISFFAASGDIGDPAGDGRPDGVCRLWVGAKPHGDIRINGDILIIGKGKVGGRRGPKQVTGMV